MAQLTPADRDRIMQLLAADQPLPASDRELLFPATGEDVQQSTTTEATEDVDTGPTIPLCFSLYSAWLAIGKTYWPFLEKYGITYPQLLALRHIRDGITVNELGTLIFLDSGTLTPLLKRLEAAGLVRRERDSKDERRVRLFLTEKGQQIRDDALDTIRTVLPNTSGWKRSDMFALARQVSQFRSDLLGVTNEEKTATTK